MDLKSQYLELCKQLGKTPRACVDRYPDEHLKYFIGQLENQLEKETT